MLLTKVFYEDKEIENERLELTDKNSRYSLGPNLTLRNCTLVLKVSARDLYYDGAHLIDCTLEVKQELKNHQQWLYAALEGCRFKGRMSGCDFGRWPGYAKGWERGSIQNCDFTEALLDGCRFHGCDARTLRFPSWPCFTILDPIRRSQELSRVQWPGRFGSVVVEDLQNDPPSTVAVTFSAPAQAKWFGFKPEEFKPVLEKFDFIVY
jgi:hypothetical protein